MVRAILDGRKTQTRRIVKRNAPTESGGVVTWKPGGADAVFQHDGPAGEAIPVPSGWAASWCPYGAPGDRLWVRETFSTSALSVYPCPPAWYRADFGKHEDPRQESHVRECDNGARPVSECWRCTAEREGAFRWCPSIFMPRALSRITLAVESVRVERLHLIDDAGALAEGVGAPFPLSHRDSFRNLWSEINGAESWDANPWVWVIGFSRVTP